MKNEKKKKNGKNEKLLLRKKTHKNIMAHECQI